MPTLLEKHERNLHDPALCEQLPVRDYLDNAIVRTSGALVAGYELKGLLTYFASDEGRDRGKLMLESLLRLMPEQSMRLQLRYEVVQDLGGLLDRYIAVRKSQRDEVVVLDDLRVERWANRELEGHYMRPILHAYFIWDPREHHRFTGKEVKRRPKPFRLSAKACIERSRREHDDLMAEFNSLMQGIETAMQAADIGARRMTDHELFVETRRALNPLRPDFRSYRSGENQIQYRSAREQIADASIVDETDSYLNIDGILYSVVTLKDLPDATFPGILRELVSLDFPLVVNTQIVIPDQAKVLKEYKTRLRKMQAAQRDSHGGYKVNVEAQVAESQLLGVQQDIISSSVKTAKLSLTLVTRTSIPAVTLAELEQAERVISDQRQRILSAIARMNGAKGVSETLAKKRIFFNSLPGMAEENKREHDVLTTNAADLLPAEMPWTGTPRSPLFLLETPYRQLIPYSPFDPSLSDANMLLLAKTGGGKTFMVQQLLLMSSRDNPFVSIIERGDSYRPLVELMGGQMVAMSLDGDQTINPWDLPASEREPSRDQIAFLKNLTRHMLGDNGSEDAELLDNLISEAIQRTYKRCAIRQSNPIPVFSDFADELAQWRDEQKNQKVMEMARVAAIKLRSWTGEKGIYAKLFDRPTTVRLSDPWLFFNIEQLADDPRLEAAMSLLIAYTTSQRASGKSGKRSYTVCDEMKYMLQSQMLAGVLDQLYRTARKRNGSIWGITQAPDEIVGPGPVPSVHGAGILKNCSTKIIGQQLGDTTALREHLFLNDTAINQIKHFSSPHKGRSADALIAIGEKADTTHSIRISATPVDYWIMTTYPRERLYRSWFLEQRKSVPLLTAYRELGATFPLGLADLDPLPEERSGEVAAIGASKL